MSNEQALNSENLISQSADLGSWSEGSSSYTTVTSNATTSPDGTTTAAQLTGLTGTNKKAIYHPISAGTGSYTSVCFVKPDGHEYVQLMFGGAATIYQNYHLSGSGTLGNGTNDAASIDKFGDWYRITLTSNALSSASNFYVVMVDSNTAARYEDSTSTSSIYAWGANFSSTNQKVFNSTTTQIHREYAPLLKTAAADEPRFEYAADGQSVGLLIEAQSSNLLTYSEDWTNSDFTKFVAITSNAAIAPTGELAADLVAATSSPGDHITRQSLTVVSGKTYTLSVFAKASGCNFVRVGGASTAAMPAQASFDLVNGTIGTVDYGTAKIEDVGNGFYRCSVTGTAASNTSTHVEIRLMQSDNTPSWTGDDYSGLLLFGQMAEQSSSVSSYIKSTSSSVSRASDSCSVANFGFTGGPVSITTEVTAAASADGTQRIFTLFENSDLVSTYFSGGGDIKTFVDAGGSTQVDASILADAVSGTDYRIGISFDTNDYRGVSNGTLGNADTSCTLPAFSSPTLQIAAQSGGSNPLSGHIKRLALYNVALSDVELQSLTSS